MRLSATRLTSIKTLGRGVASFPGNSLPTGAAIVTGNALEGSTLSVDTSSIADSDGLGTFSFQWTQDLVPISGATSNTYMLQPSNVGKIIRVTVSYTDGNGKLESLISDGLGPIAGLIPRILLESSFYLLLETGDRLLLEET